MDSGHQQLINTSLHIISQLVDLTSKLTSEQYTAELDLLHGNSIGKHMRHIAEFFDLLVHTPPPGPVNYDCRQRDLSLETDPVTLIKKLGKIANSIPALRTDAPLHFEQSYADLNKAQVRIDSTVARELSYNIEHAIHHMAIIKIAVATVFPNVPVNDAFGVAYSTLRHRKAGEAG